MLQVALEELAEEAASAGSSGAIAEVAAEMSLYRKKIKAGSTMDRTCLCYLDDVCSTDPHGGHCYSRQKRRIT